MIRLFLISLLMATQLLGAAAQEQPLSEVEIQQRVDAISKTLRCVVCQNQSIYESNAPLAADMRRTVEARVRAGDTDEEVKEYLREPYGDFILMRPPFQMNTLVLWLVPFILLASLIWWYVRKRTVAKAIRSTPKLDHAARERLNRALWENGRKDDP